MNTETLLRTESAYRTERAARPSIRRDVARLPRTLARVLWHPRRLGPMIAAVRRAGRVDEAACGALTSVDAKADWHAGRA